MKSFSPLCFLFATTLFVSFSCNRIDTDSKQSDNKTESVTLKCTTIPASNVLSTSAMLNGFLSITGLPQKTETVEAVFYYSSDETDASAIVQGGTKVSAGSFTLDDCAFNAVVNGLSVNTEYHFVASVILGGKEMTGSVLSFRTALKSTELTETGAASDITEISAILTSYANPTPEMSDVMMGIIYSQEDTPTVDNGKTLYAKELDENNSYKFSVKDLIPGTQYYYRSFVKYGGVYRYGKVLSFKTYDIVANVETLDAEVWANKLVFKGKLDFSSKAELDVAEYGFYCADWRYSNGEEYTLEKVIGRGEKCVVPVDENGMFVLEYPCVGRTYSYVSYAKIHNIVFYGNVMTASVDKWNFLLKDAFLYTPDNKICCFGEISGLSHEYDASFPISVSINFYEDYYYAQLGTTFECHSLWAAKVDVRGSFPAYSFYVEANQSKFREEIIESGTYYIRIEYSSYRGRNLCDDIFEVKLEEKAENPYL